MRSLLAATAAAATISALLVPSTVASADVSSYPPGIDTRVTSNVDDYEWMLRATNAEQAWTQATGDGVTVAVIDTGVDSTHPDLSAPGKVLPGAVATVDKQGNVLLTDDPSGTATSDDWYGHGSHVAGIIAGHGDTDGFSGIAPDASILPIDLLPRDGAPETDVDFFTAVAKGIDYAVDNGANVINMSLGGQSSAIAPSPHNQTYLDALNNMCNAVAAATLSDVVVVASAGNSGDFGNPEEKPGACPKALTVAALAPSLERTFWSSYDAAVDVAAPGQDVLSVDSTVADASPTPQVQFSGTSMASPVVAGVAALLREQNPGWTADQIEDQITSTAEDLGVPGRDPNYGYGAVDAAAALGVLAQPPKAQDDFATWSEDVHGAAGDSTVISWTTPSVHAVSGYTVTVYTETGSADYNVDGNTVRETVALPSQSWWVVTAHTTAGDVETYPQTPGDTAAGSSPERLTGVGMTRKSDTMTIKWNQPVNPTTIDVIRADVYYPRCGLRPTHQRLKVDQANFPDHMAVKLPRAARWCDAHLTFILLNKDDSGNIVGGRYQQTKATSPALYGSSVTSAASAGPRSAEVTGKVSQLNAHKVCHNKTCAGKLADLTVVTGNKTRHFHPRFTSNGDFHVVVPVPAGTKSIRAKIDGPGRLSSGPLVRVKIPR